MTNFFDDPPPLLGSPFKPGHISLVLRALELVWQELPSTHLYHHSDFENVNYDDEDAINSRLVELLNRLLRSPKAPWFSNGTFQNIHRDAKTASIQHGTEKMPDITICLKDGGRFCPRDNALFIECKVLRQGHSSQTLKNYVEKGMMRFIDKRYSTFATQAIMVAYTEPAFEPVPKLSGYFGVLPSGHPHLICDALFSFAPLNTEGTPHLSRACKSEHDRGDHLNLEITHLWLYKK